MITVVIVKKQIKKGKARSSQTMVDGKKLSHYKEVSQKRKRMTFLYHEFREQIGRSKPRRKSEHNQGCYTKTSSRWNSARTHPNTPKHTQTHTHTDRTIQEYNNRFMDPGIAAVYHLLN